MIFFLNIFLTFCDLVFTSIFYSLFEKGKEGEELSAQLSLAMRTDVRKLPSHPVLSLPFHLQERPAPSLLRPFNFFSLYTKYSIFL